MNLCILCICQYWIFLCFPMSNGISMSALKRFYEVLSWAHIMQIEDTDLRSFLAILFSGCPQEARVKVLALVDDVINGASSVHIVQLRELVGGLLRALNENDVGGGTAFITCPPELQPILELFKSIYWTSFPKVTSNDIRLIFVVLFSVLPLLKRRELLEIADTVSGSPGQNCHLLDLICEVLNIKLRDMIMHANKPHFVGVHVDVEHKLEQSSTRVLAAREKFHRVQAELQQAEEEHASIAEAFRRNEEMEQARRAACEKHEQARRDACEKYARVNEGFNNVRSSINHGRVEEDKKYVAQIAKVDAARNKAAETHAQQLSAMDRMHEEHLKSLRGNKGTEHLVGTRPADHELALQRARQEASDHEFARQLAASLWQ